MGSLVYWFLMVLVDLFLFLCLFFQEMIFNYGDALLFFLIDFSQWVYFINNIFVVGVL